MNPTCPYCRQTFRPTPYRPDQRVCSQTECQRRRRREYRRRKLAADPVYRQTCQESQQAWREAHPGYSTAYRRARPEQVARNRAGQRRRDLLRRLRRAGTQPAAGVAVIPGPLWLVGPPGGGLAKNTLALAQLVVLSGVAINPPFTRLAKNTLAWPRVEARTRDPDRAGPPGPS